MTNIVLMNVPFESNYKDTVWFESRTAQTIYMGSRGVTGFADFSYQRKDNIIRIPAHIDSLYNCNYVCYENKVGDITKRFYAFITDMKYVNDERTDITIQTDVIQTWMFKEDGTPGYVVKPSFVEREHVNDDTIGINTVPEQVETGEYICDFSTSKRRLNYGGIVVGATINLAEDVDNMFNDWLWGESSDNKFDVIDGQMYNGIYSGVKYFYFADINKLNKVLALVADCGQSDGIVCMFMAPSALFDTTNEKEDGDQFTFNDEQIYRVMPGTDVKTLNWNELIDGENDDVVPLTPTSLAGYIPRNKKLLTFPYCYLLASNNSGGANVYRYELFEDEPDFIIIGAVTPGMSIRLIPLSYGGVAENNNEGLNLGKFPICSWNNDVYTNWLTQNSVNIGMDLLSGVGQTVAGVAMAVGTGGIGAVVGGGSILGGITSIGGTLGQVYQQSHISPAVNGNLNSGDVTFSSGKLTFTLYQMNIKKEYAQIIDEYFDMFGYKVNRVKVPNTNHRTRYWYTKTIDVNIDGAIPNKDLEEIKQCYNRGITFWKYDPENNDNWKDGKSDMGNYASKDMPNTIIEQEE